MASNNLRDLEMMRDQTNSYGVMVVNLDKEYYYPGEYITGKILLKLHMDFPSQDIKLSMMGVEQLKDITNEKKNIRKELYNQSITVKGNDYNQSYNQLQTGKHVFPFKIKLHENIPGTCKVFDGRIKGKISHNIVCILDNSSLKQNILCKQRVNVREYLENKPQHTYEAEIYKTIYSCFGCINQSECHILCVFDRFFYSSADHGNLKLLIHNESGLDIASFSATLWNVYSKKASTTQNEQKQFSASNTESQLVLFKKQIREQIYEGVKAKSSQLEKLLDFQFINYDSNLPLPPSVQGTFTVNYYFVEVKAHFEGCSTQPLILQVPVSLVLTTKEPPRTMREIQTGVISKQKLKQQEKEVVVQEFSEKSHYQILHTEIDLSVHQNLYDVSYNTGLQQNQNSDFPRQSYQMNNVNLENRMSNRNINNDNYNQYSQNNSYHKLLDIPNQDKLRYTQYKSQFQNTYEPNNSYQNNQSYNFNQTNQRQQDLPQFNTYNNSNQQERASIQLHLQEQPKNVNYNNYYDKQQNQQYQNRYITNNTYQFNDNTPKFSG